MAEKTEPRGKVVRVGGLYKAVYPHNGFKYVIERLYLAEEAGLVCDLLTVKDALDGKLNLDHVQLYSQSQLPAHSVLFGAPLSAVTQEQLANVCFSEVVRQLQDCVALNAESPTEHSSASGRLLYSAAKLGHASVALLLLLVDPGTLHATSYSTGWTPLHSAAMSGQEAVVRVLLAAASSAASNADIDGQLPLHLAANKGHTSICQLLLDKAGSETVTVASSNGWLPLHLAARNGHTATCQLLLEKAPETAAATASDESGHTAICKLLLDRAPHTARMAHLYGWLPLHLAAEDGHTATCQLLLERAPITATTVNKRGFVPLHLAAQNGHTATCQALLDTAPHTARVAADDGGLPLHFAAYGRYTATCQLLVDRAPEAAAAIDSEGRLLLHAALVSRFGPLDLGTARFLLAFGSATAVLAALHSTPAALPLFADFVIARPSLTSEEWAAVPTPCSGLGRALPAVLARSTDQARQLVQHLPPADAQRLRTAALSLHRAQTVLDRALPAPVVCSILALSLFL
ncbi:Ankyrin-1 [Chlorella vulgaris]